MYGENSMKSIIQEQFESFYKNSNLDFNSDTIDYFGVNISEVSNEICDFKIYYKDRHSRDVSHPLIEYLLDKDMIRYITMVQDIDVPMRKRFDIGLKKRTRANMNELFDYLYNNSVIFKEFENEIKTTSLMKINDFEEYDFASLYFLGFISYGEDIEVLKCHYFNRFCDNPDILHKNYRFDDEYYLDFLSKTEISQYVQLSVIVRRLLEICGGHLWMTGSDYSSDKLKYKIYIKNPDNVYDGLAVYFGDLLKRENRLVEKIRTIKKWNSKNPVFWCEGFAVCLSDDNELSINFYYKLKKESSEL